MDVEPEPAGRLTGRTQPGRLNQSLSADLCAQPGADSSLIIVGLGNDIACDDAVGILAARRLRGLLGGRATVIELPWAGLHLLDALRGFDAAILIDSLKSQRVPPGTVVQLSEDDLAGSVRLNSFHDLNYLTAMALGRRLHWQLPEHVEIYAIEGQVFDYFGTQLTPAVARGLQQVVALIASRLGINAAAMSTSACGGDPW